MGRARPRVSGSGLPLFGSASSLPQLLLLLPTAFVLRRWPSRSTTTAVTWIDVQQPRTSNHGSLLALSRSSVFSFFDLLLHLAGLAIGVAVAITHLPLSRSCLAKLGLGFWVWGRVERQRGVEEHGGEEGVEIEGSQRGVGGLGLDSRVKTPL